MTPPNSIPAPTSSSKTATGGVWEFAFIYYNNRRFGGTRNEYRLTRMTRYIRQAGLVSGDDVILHRDVHGRYSIEHQFTNSATSTPMGSALKLSGGWHLIDISR